MFIQHPFYPTGYKQVQLTEFVNRITPPPDTVRVIIQPENQSIRFRDDNIDPTVNTGIQVANNETFILDSATESLRLISVALSANATNAVAVVNSTAVNSDLTFTSIDTGPEWNGFTFVIIEDAIAGVNATATLDINAANGDLIFTAPAQSNSYNGIIFESISDVAESVIYDANSTTFTLNYIAATSNASTMKSEFDSAVTGNPNWPQFSCVVEGDGSGVWDVVDDGANDTSSGGVTPINPSIDYANATFTIHTITATTLASEVKTLWANGPNECDNWICEDEGNGNGVVNASSGVSANGADGVGSLVNLLFYREI